MALNERYIRSDIHETKRHNIPCVEFVQMIEKEIKGALEKNQDRRGDASLWDDIPCAGEYPTVYELVMFLAHKVSEFPNRKSIWD